MRENKTQNCKGIIKCTIEEGIAMDKIRIVKSKAMAGALVWLGFAYTKDSDNNFVFTRDKSFDMAWQDIHALRALYYKQNKN